MADLATIRVQWSIHVVVVHTYSTYVLAPQYILHPYIFFHTATVERLQQMSVSDTLGGGELSLTSATRSISYITPPKDS